MEYYIIPNSKDVENIRGNLILPLEEYSIGFDTYFSVDLINEISSTREVSVIINRFLHKSDIESIKNVLSRLKNIKYYFIEDLGLINLIDKEKIVLNQVHIINNYEAINYFDNLGIKNIVVSNELTIEELEEIRKNTKSNLFYTLIARNQLMYSKRHLISSYYEYKNIKNGSFIKDIKEDVSKKDLIIKEEKGGTLIFDKRVFSALEYKERLNGYNFIINLSNMSEEETKKVLSSLETNKLDMEVDNYFVNNKIGYKVGVLK